MEVDLTDMEVSDNEGEGPESSGALGVASSTLKPVVELVMAPVEALESVNSASTSGKSKDGTPSQKEILVEVKSQENRDDDSSLRPVMVDLQQMRPLPYRGGFLDKRNGTKYLHAGMQTDRKPKPKKNIQMFSRTTQKCLMRNQNWNTIRETFTQMDRRDLILDWSRDYARVPGRYVDSIEWEQIRRRASIVIQKYTRRWIAQRNADRIRGFVKSRLEFFEDQEKTQKVQEEDALQREIERRMCPRTSADFAILYEELEAWRVQEMEKLNACNYGYNERVNALRELLTKELKLLTAIDKLRATAAKANRKDRIKRTMLKMCAPKVWELTNGKTVQVRTPATARASDLMHLYTALGKEVTNIDERMAVLGYVKWTVQEFTNPLTKEILLLIEREADLMYRNRPAKSLVGLRHRILALFLHFIETPEFNPEAAAHQYVHNDYDFKQKQSMLRRDQPLELSQKAS
ncbi:flagellar associated protein 253 [Selaginella moellendorffii]|uniref:Flagellar associated protein 253 n=1 Tax=Selaginella moellendorffii TaxID=88036 RepID=D8QTX3_SELML|nr:IQ and ubiquitin-like domain-containing protein [Selaginella moellendorffii]EFJ36723.1 flagellar associated protein 253 [Selaginella moellendorffii]|eukprot:XP_002961463.1 IQ and ubiquitin-like domain-containing protein [Selaginella moellendorffii]